MSKRRPCPDLRSQRSKVLVYVEARVKDASNGCWEWTGCRNALGYAYGYFGGRVWGTTRLVWCAFVGEFDPKQDILHTCDNPPCCNPAHLFLGDAEENAIDCIEKERHHSSKTHCIRGHELSGDNLYVSTTYGKPRRHCRTCDIGNNRIRSGWPPELAYTLPRACGYRPPGLGPYIPPKRLGRVLKTHCKHGHAYDAENTYYAPADGRRMCRACKHDVVKRIIARRKTAEYSAVNGTGSQT